jgi:hypothetical protein
MRDEQITTGRLPFFEEDTVLVISHWEYVGKGFSTGDALLASAITGMPHPRGHMALDGGLWDVKEEPRW